MAALDDYGPFDSGVGANRTEDFWRDFFRHLTGSGVIDGVGSEFAVVERGAGANLSVDVGSGECFIRGHWGESTATKNVAISTGHATNPRIDRVVLRADFSANTISIEVLEGTPAGSPSAPALTQSSSRWEVSLAQISVPALDTSIGTAQITDERALIGPWGGSGKAIIGSAQNTTLNQLGIGTTFTAVTGSALTSVNVPAAGAVLHAIVNVQKKGGAGFASAIIRDTTAGAYVGIGPSVDGAVDDYLAIPVMAVVAPGAGPRSYELRVAAESNTVDVIGFSFYIEGRVS